MIRHALLEEIDEILKIYKIAKKIMIKTGNENQWLNGYPSKELLIDDINKKQLYVIEQDGIIHAAFAFIIGDDPTYSYIEGKWISNTSYGTIHRIGSDGIIHNMLKEAVTYAFNITKHVRIDTHEKNIIMNHLLPKLGFIYCGIIYISDGSPRLAYELI